MYSRFPVQCAEALCLLLFMHTVLLVPQWIVHPDLKSTYCFYAYMHEIMNFNHSKSACTIHWASMGGGEHKNEVIETDESIDLLRLESDGEQLPSNLPS